MFIHRINEKIKSWIFSITELISLSLIKFKRICKPTLVAFKFMARWNETARQCTGHLNILQVKIPQYKWFISLCKMAAEYTRGKFQRVLHDKYEESRSFLFHLWMQLFSLPALNTSFSPVCRSAFIPTTCSQHSHYMCQFMTQATQFSVHSRGVRVVVVVRW